MFTDGAAMDLFELGIWNPCGPSSGSDARLYAVDNSRQITPAFLSVSYEPNGGPILPNVPPSGSVVFPIPHALYFPSSEPAGSCTTAQNGTMVFATFVISSTVPLTVTLDLGQPPVWVADVISPPPSPSLPPSPRPPSPPLPSPPHSASGSLRIDVFSLVLATVLGAAM